VGDFQAIGFADGGLLGIFRIQPHGATGMRFRMASKISAELLPENVCFPGAIS
jgi:hypothetical protein